MSKFSSNSVPSWISSNSNTLKSSSNTPYNPAAVAASSTVSAAHAKFYSQGPQGIGKRNKRQQYMQQQNYFANAGYQPHPRTLPIHYHNGLPQPRHSITPNLPPRGIGMLRPSTGSSSMVPPPTSQYASMYYRPPPPLPLRPTFRPAINQIQQPLTQSRINHNNGPINSSLNHNVNAFDKSIDPNNNKLSRHPIQFQLKATKHSERLQNNNKNVSKSVISSISNNNCNNSDSAKSSDKKSRDNSITKIESSTSKEKDDSWPQSLQDYVANVFKSFPTPEERKKIQPILREMISTSIANGTLKTTDWEKVPHPQLSKPNISQVSSSKESTPKRKASSIVVDTNESEQITQLKKNRRMKRFQNDNSSSVQSSPHGPNDNSSVTIINELGDLDLEAMTIKGTCQTIEKRYFRLTSPPNPWEVRPQEILQKAVKLVKKKWAKGKCDYEYACSQMKSIRQDLTVQRIKNNFTVKVYESHARIALQEGDMNEFNQCQTQLRELYEQHNLGNEQCKIEFLAYRILYCTYTQDQQSNPALARIEINNILSQIKPSDKLERPINHALRVREAVAMKNYVLFFQLYTSAPNYGGAILSKIKPKIRLDALRIICNAYRPTVPLNFIRQVLAIGEDENEFINESGLVLLQNDKHLIDTKASKIVATLSKTSLI